MLLLSYLLFPCSLAPPLFPPFHVAMPPSTLYTSPFLSFYNKRLKTMTASSWDVSCWNNGEGFPLKTNAASNLPQESLSVFPDGSPLSQAVWASKPRTLLPAGPGRIVLFLPFPTLPQARVPSRATSPFRSRGPQPTPAGSTGSPDYVFPTPREGSWVFSQPNVHLGSVKLPMSLLTQRPKPDKGPHL